LGLRPEIDGLRIDPCIPSDWDGFKATRCFRGVNLVIEVVNPEGVRRNVKSIKLNGIPLSDNLLPVGKLLDENRVEVVLGES
jgi:cellobiose phosphorylase